MQTRVQAHTVYQLGYHIVFIPKYRRKVLVDGVDEYAEDVMKSYLADKYPDVQVEEMNIRIDHVHLLLIIPPKYAISTVVGDLKANSSKELRKKFEYLKRNENLWSIGFYVSAVGINEEKIRNYIKYQEQQDKGQALLAF